MAVSLLQSSTFARKFRMFLRWMCNNGIEYTDGLAFELGGSMSVADIGVRAVYSMQINELIATIPKQACLTVKTTAVAVLIEKEEIGGELGLVVALMYERSLQEGSRWYGYLQLLPHKQKLPFLWSLKEIDSLLQGSELHQVIKEDRVLLEEDWKDSITPLSLRHPNDFPENWFTLDHFLAAKTLVASRAFAVDEYHGHGMVPLADLFNHKTAVEDVHFTSVTSDLDSDTSVDDHESPPKASQGKKHAKATKRQNKSKAFEPHHQAKEFIDVSPSAWEGESELLEMILVRDVGGGAEIFNTYGTLSNAALLHRYGFTEPNNPYDIVNIDLTMVVDVLMKKFSSRHVRQRISHWKKVGCAPCISQDCEYFEISVTGKPQEDLLMFLLLVHLSENAFDSFSVLDSVIDQGIECSARALGWAGPPREGLAQSKKRSRQSKQSLRENEEIDLASWLLTAYVCKSMHLLLEKRDGLYPTSSLEEDLAQLSRTSRYEQPEQFHALTLRASERSILKRCQDIVSQRLVTLTNDSRVNN